MSRDDIHGVSPERLRELARAEWDARYAFSCAHDPATEGVRIEGSSLRCGRCDAVVLLRRRTA